MTTWLRREEHDLLLWVRVTPKSGRDRFDGIAQDAIRLRITAPPVDGKANRHIIAWLAREFQVPKSRVNIEAGDRSRRKRIRIREPRRIPDALAPFLEQA